MDTINYLLRNNLYFTVSLQCCLRKTTGHLLRGSCYERRSEDHYRACYWAGWWPYHQCEKTQIVEMVSGLAKMILQGMVQGGWRKGRQKKRWEDNISEWTGLVLGEALWKAEGQRGVEKSGCPIVLDAATVIQTKGWVSEWVRTMLSWRTQFRLSKSVKLLNIQELSFELLREV